MHEDEMPIGQANDLRYQKFGRLTPLYRVKVKGPVKWKCKCDCGNEIVTAASRLVNGTTKSCGCYNKELIKTRYVDILGQKFGRLLVIEKTDKRTSNGSIIWKCQCDCGNTTEQVSYFLRKGIVQSCGCLQKEIVSKNNSKKIKDLTNKRVGKLTVIKDSGERKININNSREVLWLCRCDCGNEVKIRTSELTHERRKTCGKCDSNVIKDLAGQRFGQLTVLELYPERTKEGAAQWLCSCSCGNTTITKGSNLIKGATLSCGCLKSRGEKEIGLILKNNNIPFKTQKTFETCRFPETNSLARFDFYVDDKYLIEYDGIQHFGYNNRGWDTADKFNYTQNHDFYKNQWCKDNNIPLIRIPYTHLTKLCIEDLLLETTTFLI